MRKASNAVQLAIALYACCAWAAVAFLFNPKSTPKSHSFSGRSRGGIIARLGGGVDPPFRFGGDGQDGPERFQQPQQQQQQQAQQQGGIPITPPALKPNDSASQMPLKLQGFMEGTKLVPQIGGMPFMSGNCYVDLIVTMSPKEMITKFKTTAPPRVQDAVKRTVLRCIGSIQDNLVEDSHRTTGLIFANLLYKAQVTGYMLFNAESKVQNLLSAPTSIEVAQKPQNLLPTGADADEFMKLEGAIKIVGEDGIEAEVDAQEYVEALKAEAASLKTELVRMEQEKRQLVSRDLLSYISELSTSQSGQLTSGMTQYVVEAMKMLVNRVLASIQDRPIVEKESMELDSSALAQLIMWGLVTGYSLRELEAAWGDYGPISTFGSFQPPQPSQPARPKRGGGPPPPPPGRGRRPRGKGPEGPRGGRGGGG